jgi:hypothetical protein
MNSHGRLTTGHEPLTTRRTFFRNLVPGTARLHTLATMSQTPESAAPNPFSAGSARQEPGRPFRIKLRALSWHSSDCPTGARCGLNCISFPPPAA